jgi:GTP cyclohydrolase II
LILISAKLLSSGAKFRERYGRPLVTLSYAQSLDGSIALSRGNSCKLSGTESQTMTHRLRASHDSILVGIGTVLADNPQLTVRLVEGHSPIPIVLDSLLRLPPGSNLLNNKTQPLIITTPAANMQRQHRLEECGARIVRAPADERGWVDLGSMLTVLADLGINSVMVEGGARIITSFLSRHMVDRMIITITPRILGGLHAVENPLSWPEGENRDGEAQPEFSNFGYDQVGRDIVFWSSLSWKTI